MPPSTHIIPKFYYFREGGHTTVTGVIAWGLRKSCKIETSWSPVGSRLRPSASPCILMIPICTSNKLEPKSLNPMSYQVVAHFTRGGKGSPTQPTPISSIFFNFVFLMHYLYLLIHSIYLVLHTHARKTNTNALVRWCAKIQT